MGHLHFVLEELARFGAHHVGGHGSPGVLAHELGHHVHKDIPILVAFGTVMTLGGLYLASLAMNWAAGSFGFSGPADIAGLPALGLILGAYGQPETSLSAIDLRFEQHCEGSGPALHGKIHWEAGDTTTAPGPVTPPSGLWQPATGSR